MTRKNVQIHVSEKENSDALDLFNPLHHQHIGVGLSILFFEGMFENFIDIVMNFMTQCKNL